MLLLLLLLLFLLLALWSTDGLNFYTYRPPLGHYPQPSDTKSLKAQ